MSVLKDLDANGLGCGSDGVRAKVLVVRALQKEKGLPRVGDRQGAAKRQLCLQSLHNLPLYWAAAQGFELWL